MSTHQEVVERALAYPYAVPPHSYLLARGDARELRPGEARTSGRTSLLAYGSNAAPEVLARKLGESMRDEPVLALRTTLTGFDVVYSAHISRYGSVPATLQRSPGTEVTVFVLHLSEDQLRLIAATEPNYERVQLSDVSCRIEHGETLTELVAYISRHGSLSADGSGISLSEVEARGRKFRSMSQSQVQEHVRAILAPDLSLEQFIAENSASPEIAQSRTAALRSRQSV